MKRGVLALTLILLPAVAGVAGGDVLHLTNGNRLRGEVIREEGDSVVLRTPNSLLTIPRADIASVERETRAETLRGQIEEALAAHRYDQALELLRGALQENPGDPQLRALFRSATVGHIRALVAAGLYDEAASALGGAATAGFDARDVEDVRSELERGRAKMKELLAAAEGSVEVGRYEQALQAYRELLRFAPARRAEFTKAEARAYREYGDSLLREQNYGDARRQYEEALALDPELLPQLQTKLIACTLTVVEGELERAEGPLPRRKAVSLGRQLQELLALDADLPHSHFLLGVLYEHTGRGDLALAEYERALGRAVPGASLAARLATARADAQELAVTTPLKLDTTPAPEDWSYSEPGDWQVDASDHFRLHHHNPRVSARLLAAAEYQLEREAPLFALTPETAWPGKCDIFLYGSAEAYQRATGRPAWSPAVSTFILDSEGAPTQLAIHTHQEAKLIGQTVVPHELGHLLLARVTDYVPDLPLWIQEGVATAQEPGFKVTHLLQEVAARRQAGTALTLAEVLNAKTYPRAEDVDHFYGLSYTLVDYLLTKADFEHLRRFALSARTDVARALLDGYGMKMEEFERNWEKHLESLVRPPASQPARLE
jgi:tetratricopeptide (TPR) repeat protein